MASIDTPNDDLAVLAAQHRWHHSIDLGGVVTKGDKPASLLQMEADAIFGRVELSGRSVLDVGAWNGYFSFEARKAVPGGCSRPTPTVGKIRIFGGERLSICPIRNRLGYRGDAD